VPKGDSQELNENFSIVFLRTVKIDCEKPQTIVRNLKFYKLIAFKVFNLQFVSLTNVYYI
jgi:hypothetical protein